jgi:hypothetical protein
MKQKNQEERKRKGHILISSSSHTYRFLMINKTSQKNSEHRTSILLLKTEKLTAITASHLHRTMQIQGNGYTRNHTVH